MLKLFFMLLFAISSVQAAYITDKLLVGFYTKPDASAQPVKVLPSSTPMQVLGTNGAYSKVRLGDGKEGWVKSIYISNEKPARAMLLELQAKSSIIQKKLQQAEKALKTTQSQGETATPKSAGDTAELQKENERLKALLKNAGSKNSGDLGKLQLELSQSKQRLSVVGSALKDEQKESERLKALLKNAGNKNSGDLGKLQKELSQSSQKLSVVENALKDEQKETEHLKALLKNAGSKNTDSLGKLQQALSLSRKKLSVVGSALKDEQRETKRLRAMLKQTGSKKPVKQSRQVKALTSKLAASKLELKATLHEAKLLQGLLKKTDQAASARIATLEREVIQAKKGQSSNSANSALIKQNALLKKRLRQVSKILGTSLPEAMGESDSESSSWTYLFILLLAAGLVGVIIFKNKYIRQRYKGFRV